MASKPYHEMTEADHLKQRDGLLHATRFVVEAQGAECQLLWEKFCKQSMHKTALNVHTWEQLNPGYCVHVGQFADFPVMISLRWFRIDGVLVMFWESCSRVVDYKLCEKWLEAHCAPRWDKGRRLAHTDAMNFHHVLNYIRDESRRW